MDKKWKNKDMSWEDFKAKCSQTIRTTETVSEYRKMSKPAQDSAKDVGGFVGGALKQGKRKNGFVEGRSLLTLDLDHAVVGVWDAVTMLFDFKCLMYSTHKHTPEAPRVRLIIPLSREIYIPADSSAGIVIYDDKFAYSHHATDPVCGQLMNAFDVVRVHKYGSLDDKAKVDTAPTMLPFFKGMVELVIRLQTLLLFFVMTSVCMRLLAMNILVVFLFVMWSFCPGSS